MKLVFESLDALMAELRDRKVGVVRISPAVELDRSPGTDGVPHVVMRVLVTATIDDHQWAEWRLWIGRATGAAGPGGGVQLPASLRDPRDRALADISKRVDDAGFQIREGIVTHDMGVMDCFAPLGAERAFSKHLASEPPRDREQEQEARGRRIGLVMLAVFVTSLIAGIAGVLAAVKLGWTTRP
jgi:hypothetical protein